MFDGCLVFQIVSINDIHYKPVGFYGPIAPPVPNAPSSECPRASIAARRRAAGSIRISRRASCCCCSAIAGIAIGANFKIYFLRQFCSNRVQFLANVNSRSRSLGLYAVARPSVVCLSVTFVRPTQAVQNFQIFGNISTALGILAIH